MQSVVVIHQHKRSLGFSFRTHQEMSSVVGQTSQQDKKKPQSFCPFLSKARLKINLLATMARGILPGGFPTNLIATLIKYLIPP